MSELIQLRGVGHEAGPRTLFSAVDLTLASGERLGLVGANGSGKSTLLRILAGALQPGRGERTGRRGLRVARLEQEPRFDAERTVSEFVLSRLANDPGPPKGADPGVAARRALGQAGFSDPDARIATLSGGWRRRLALAAELATDADLLLLDEPTNHLDLDGIEWLERGLAAMRGGLVVISHDRRFLETVCTRMAELDPRHPGGVLVCAGRYSDFLEQREQALAEARGREASLNSVLREEIRYLRQGPKARTSKNATRVARAHENIAELERLRALNRDDEIDARFSDTGRRTRRLLVAESIGVARGAQSCFAGLDLVLSPGIRIGLVGPNGSGKTTLLRTLLGEHPPDTGSVRAAPDLRTVYFDQGREQLDGDRTLRRALAPEGDTVQVGVRSLHVTSWARQLLFRDDQLDQPVRTLSGGERARLLVARLMRTPADVLLLDEPTNDLDIPTIEALERSLCEFEGAVVLVSHDRFLMDRACTGLLALDGRGGVREFADLAQYRASLETSTVGDPAPRPAPTRPRPAAPASAKLSFNEKRELESMEQRLLEAEEAAGRLENDAASEEDPDGRRRAYEELGRAQAEIERLYARWAELDEKKRRAGS